MAFEKEVETYYRELPQLLEKEGKFVLLHESEVIGFWDTEEEAVEAGDDRFGLDPFLVKQIRSKEQPVVVPYPVTPLWPS